LEFTENAIPELPIIVEFSFGKVEFGLFTIRDLEKMKGKPLSGAYSLACCVRNMTADQAYGYFQNARGEDFEVLDYIDKIIYHGLEPVEVICPNYITPEDEYFDREEEREPCNHIFTISLEDSHTLVLPFRESQKSARDKIQFGNK
jgi:hypothetical protein